MTFFDTIRPMFGGKLTQVQVDAIGETVNQYGLLGSGNIRELAYILATGFHEAKFKPVRENMNYTAKRIREVWPSRFKTLAAAQPYANAPEKLANKVYGGRYGNTKPGDGWKYRGGGLPQITFYNNYKKFGLESDPDKILEPGVAARVMVVGMLNGLFTGKKLSDFIGPNGADYIGARAILNDDVAANGSKVAAVARKFEAALRIHLGDDLTGEPVEQDEPDVGAEPIPNVPPPVKVPPTGKPFPWLWLGLIFSAILAFVLFAL